MKLSWTIFKILSQHSPGWSEGNHERHVRIADLRSSDSNSAPTEYGAGMLTTRPRRLVCDVKIN
jgi:hypothetical protein